MSKRILSILLALAMVIAIAPVSVFAQDDVLSYLTYENLYGRVRITDCDESISGDVVIPDTIEGYPVTSIEENAFSDCTNLTSITIPDSVSYICCSVCAADAFSGCKSLTSITVKDANEYYSSDEYGVLFNKDKTELLLYPAGNSRTEYTIPDSVTSIGENAFYDSVYYKDEANWDNGILYIGNHLIAAKTDITECTIREGTLTIAEAAFAECKSLINITIPDSITLIGDYAFSWCTSLTSIEIPNSVTSIGNYVFLDCESLTNIEIADGATGFDRDDFNNTAYYRDEANWDNGILYIGNQLIAAKTDITECTIREGTLTIGAYAFERCKNLTSVSIPNSVTSIGYAAFKDCDSLTNVIIPDGVTEIGSCAFSGSGIQTITIPKTLTTVGGDIFNDELSTIYFTGDDTEWEELEEKFNYEDKWELGDVLICYKHENIYYTYYTEIHDDYIVFKGELTIVSCSEKISGDYTVPGRINGYNVCEIGPNAFESCTGLTSITIPESVKTIGDNAFAGCTSLTHINYLGSKETWNNSVSTGNLTEVMPNVTVIFPQASIQALEYSIVNGEAVITGCDISISGELTIPDTLDGYPVTTIGNGAFSNCEELTSVTIPDSVTVIEAGAFYCCTSLFEVNIPDSVTSIGDYAFWLCRSLKGVSIGKNVNHIGAGAFAFCESLESIIVDSSNPYYSCSSDGILFNKNQTILVQCPAGSKLTDYSIPESVTEIAEAAFEGCQNITCITIGKNVKSIGVGPFKSCLALENITVSKDNKYFSSDSNGVLFDKDKTMLIQYPINNSRTSYTIPSTVENICYGAFADAFNIKSVIIPDSVKTICEEAFWQCYNMTEITIGSGVQCIGDAAFTYCLSLSDVYYFGSQTDWNKITIGDRNEELTEYPTIHFGKNSDDKTVHNSSTVLTPNADSNIKVTDTVAASAPEMSVDDIIKSVKNDNVQILDKDGKELTKDALVGTGSKIQIFDKDGNILSTYEVMVKADVDGNGKITTADARLTLRASVGLDTIVGVYETAANYDGKDNVSTADARMILRKAVGLE